MFRVYPSYPSEPKRPTAGPDEIMKKHGVNLTDEQIKILVYNMHYYIEREFNRWRDEGVEGFLDYYLSRTYDNPRSSSYKNPRELDVVETVQSAIDQFTSPEHLKKFESAMFRQWDRDRDNFFNR